ncbi:OX1R-like protein, partial [Mya arenaria]
MESILKNLTFFAEENITISFRNKSDNISETVQSKPCKSRYSSLDEIADCFFPEPEEWVLIAGYVITFIVGVLGNVLVCFSVWRNREMRTTKNIFMVNLSVADLTVLLLLLPTTLVADVTETWLIGTTMCKLSISLGTMCISVSILTLCAISIERWYAICRPLSFHSSFQRARIIIAAIWAVSMCVALPETMCFPALWKLDMIALFQICLMVCLYFIPLGLMACLYTHIAVVLWKKRIPGTANLRMHINAWSCFVKIVVYNNTDPGWNLTASIRHQIRFKAGLRATTSNSHSQENNTCRLTGPKKAKMLGAIVTVFALCFLPNHTLNIL